MKKRLTFESWLEESDTWRETARGLIGEDDLYGERTRPRDPDESAVLRRLGLDRVQPFSAIDGSAHPASQIRRMRNRRGLSQSDLAERLGVSQQQVQQLEDPRRSNPTWRTMCKIARALDSYWDLDLLPTA